jgi:sugar lactone lactonase YvrE
VLADRYQGMRFNSPNDLTIDSKGRIYFSDPLYNDNNNLGAPRTLWRFGLRPDGTIDPAAAN